MLNICLVYSPTDENGFGHYSRMLALGDEVGRTYHGDSLFYLTTYNNEFDPTMYDVVVFDVNLENELEKNRFAQKYELARSFNIASFLVTSSSPDTVKTVCREALLDNGGGLVVLGIPTIGRNGTFANFPISDSLERFIKFKKYTPTANNKFIIIPNSQPKLFFDRAAPLIVRLTELGLGIRILPSGTPQNRIFQEMSTAELVITTASTTAIEALLLEARVALVNVSSDQCGIYRTIESIGANQTSHILTKGALNSDYLSNVNNLFKGNSIAKRIHEYVFNR